MRCESVLRRIDDHVDGLLPAEEAERVRDHLDACPPCRETAFAARAASTSLAAWGDLEPPAGCFDRILTKIDTLPPDALRRDAARPRGRLLRIFLPAAVAAAAVVTAVLVADTGRRVRQSSRGNVPVAAVRTAGVAAPATAQAVPHDPAHPHLRQGEVYVHQDSEWDWDGVRRAPRNGVVVPAGLHEMAPQPPFGTPR